MRARTTAVISASLILGICGGLFVWAGTVTNQLNEIHTHLTGLVMVTPATGSKTTTVCWKDSPTATIVNKTAVKTDRKDDDTEATYAARHWDEVEAWKTQVENEGGVIVSCE